MLTIKFTFNQEDRTYTYADDQKDVANTFFATMLASPKCTALMTINAAGVAKKYKPVSGNKCFAVGVNFKNSNKVYTYGSKKPIPIKTECLVRTPTGYDIVIVVSCTETEENNLCNITNRKKPNWVIGIVNRI